MSHLTSVTFSPFNYPVGTITPMFTTSQIYENAEETSK